MSPYQRISEVIEYMAGHYTDQPSLEELATRSGWSSYHFQRQFTQWVGITPKDFIKTLTLSHARSLLSQGENILNTSLDSGLSGPGRLHDLCVSLTAATPGEIKQGGRGLNMIYGCYETPFGTCLLGQSARGVSHLSFIRSNQVGQAIDRLQEEWPLARWQQDDTATENVVKRIFNTPPASKPRPALRAWVKGTTFQVQVWQALLSIPSGQMVSYGQLATALGRPQSARAVGNAVGANPVAWLIPCHRVIQRSGALGGYRWGGQRKRSLLAWESCQ